MRKTVVRGTFELPAAAYCGNSLLQPGHYTISFLHDMEPVAFVHIRVQHADVTFPAVSRPNRNVRYSYLDVTDIGGRYFIRAFNAGSIGASLAFGVNKRAETESLRASARPPIAVPVSTSAGF
jgi:hypothetical protein